MSDTKDNLNWLAFRFIANELNVTEASEFESLLVEDQAAREAVAQAVAETNLLGRALAEQRVATPSSRQTSWRVPTTQVVAIAAGSCLLLLGMFLAVRSLDPIPFDVVVHDVEINPPNAPAELAFAWVESRASGWQSVTSDSDSELLDSLLTAAVDVEEEDPLVAPSWMLAALARTDSAVNAANELQE